MIIGSESPAVLRTSLSKGALPIRSDTPAGRHLDETKCYLCDTSFTFLGSRRKVCYFCSQSVCDEHSRGKKENERVCDACLRELIKQDMQSSEEHEQIIKLKNLIETEAQTTETRRVISKRNEAEIARLKAEISTCNVDFEVAMLELSAKTEQEVQRVEKHQKIVSNLQQTLDDVKSSKRQAETKLAELEIKIDAIKSESYVLESRKREVEAAISEKTEEIKNSIPFYQLKTLICRSCKKYLTQSQNQALFKHVSDDNRKSFLGIRTVVPPASGLAASKCNCALF